ncbi:MAG TPA: AbrB/MazE/SpoVT family DNA-binding domain-containing protein [Longimicrobium sp.]|jgi:bifunctional DNA-binding transcriptional regulator/antitoxin component of YhaV-PrlF toxin-antitoxin module
MAFMIVDKRGRGTFPKEVRRELGLDGDDTNILLLSKTPHGTIELVPAALLPRDQLWFHHSEMQNRIAEAEADFREGRFVRTEAPEDAQAYLDRLKGDGPGGANTKSGSTSGLTQRVSGPSA